MTTGSSLAGRWRELAAGLVASLPGEWVLSGKGLRLVLARRIDPWIVEWIGFTKISSLPNKGWLHAGAESLLEPNFSFLLEFGIRMDDLRGWPGSVDLTDPESEDLLHRFAHGPALEKLDRVSADRLAEGAEEQLAKPVESRRPHQYWLMTPGWRVVRGTGSPEEPAREAIEFSEQRGIPGGAVFYGALLASWLDGGRAGALAFLETDRQRKLNTAGLEGLLPT